MEVVEVVQECSGLGCAGVDGLLVDLVDVDRAPHVVVGDPGGPFDVFGVAGVDAGDL